MKDLGDRFADAQSARKDDVRPDPLARLLQPSPADADGGENSLLNRLAQVSRRVDLIAAACALCAAALFVRPLMYSSAVSLPPIAETGDEFAVVTVRPLAEGNVTSPPDWTGLFNAYQLETSLRDISIRCNYGLPADARTDLYLHARLVVGTQIRMFLADPGKCPKP